MTISVYIAASSLEIERAERCRDLARAAGLQVVSTWTDSVRAVGESNPRTATREQREAWAMACLREVHSADVLWLLAPAATAPTRGAWAELGYASAFRRIRIVASGDTAQSIFCALADLETPNDADALAAIPLLYENWRVDLVDANT